MTYQVKLLSYFSQNDETWIKSDFYLMHSHVYYIQGDVETIINFLQYLIISEINRYSSRVRGPVIVFSCCCCTKSTLLFNLVCHTCLLRFLPLPLAVVLVGLRPFGLQQLWHMHSVVHGRPAEKQGQRIVEVYLKFNTEMLNWAYLVFHMDT